MTKTIKIQRKGKTYPITYNSIGHIKEVEKTGAFFEIHMLSAIEKLPYRPGICIDIGANVGNHTVFFSKFCKFDNVLSFEPSPNSFDLLLENVMSNDCKNVLCKNMAVGSEYGKISMTSDQNNPSWNKVVSGSDIQIVRIETSLNVALMKIDVEGHELEVIKGAYDVIEREKPELFIEWHYGYKPILDALPKGYRYVKTYNNAPSHHFTTKM